MKTTVISHSLFDLDIDFTAPNKRSIEILKTPISFDELILSWNGFRPMVGFWDFSISLFQEAWSEPLPFASWGKDVQKTCSCDSPDSFAKSHQDVAIAKKGVCTGYRIFIEARDGADFTHFHSVTVSFGLPEELTKIPPYHLASIVLTEIPASSQQILAHARARDLCSPTSTAAAINFLHKEKRINPIHFAEQVRDQFFDIYGNWILNTAAAYEALEGKYHTYVTWLPDFAALHAQLVKGLPVVVSIQGPILGGALPYTYGHLILVIGYDQIARRVLCMDPAYLSDEQTITSYCIDAFLSAWTERRRNLSYIFEKNINPIGKEVTFCVSKAKSD